MGRQEESVVRVELLSYTGDPEAVVVAAIRQCYSSIGARELKKKTDKETKRRLVDKIMASGQTSTLEHASFTFVIEGISRTAEIHLVRHRIASYSIQSGRYVKEVRQNTQSARDHKNKIVLKNIKII